MSGLDIIRTQMRQVPAWITLRRLQREGFARAFRRRRVWTKILRTPPVVTEPVRPGALVEVHLLCCEKDYLSAMWTLKSFYHHSEARYPLVIHVQGRLSRLAQARLRSHFPAARIVLQREADPIVERALAEMRLPRLAQARRENPFMLKLLDFPLLSQAGHILNLDSDVLFFRHPAALLLENAEDPGYCLYQRDVGSTYNLTEAEAREELGIALIPNINAGMMRIPRDAYDLARCEELMSNPRVARLTGWIEQTLLALCSSERGCVEFLPPEYLLVYGDANLDALVARHYAGATRPLLTSEGMRYLIEVGFLEELRASGSRGRPMEPVVPTISA